MDLSGILELLGTLLEGFDVMAVLESILELVMGLLG